MTTRRFDFIVGPETSTQPSTGQLFDDPLTMNNQGEIRLRELTANGTNYVGWRAPASLSANAVWDFPAVDGTSGQGLVTNGSKVLSFQNITAANTDFASKSADYVVLTNDNYGTIDAAAPSTSFTFTSASDVNTTTNVITKAAHGLLNGQVISFNVSTGASLAAPLKFDFPYYVVNKATDTFQVSLTVGGSAVDLTTTGSGTTTVMLGILITLPAAASSGGRLLAVSKSDTNRNLVVVKGDSAETIDGSNSQWIQHKAGCWVVHCSGSVWKSRSKPFNKTRIKINSGDVLATTNTRVRRFQNPTSVVGSAITHVISATGDYFEAQVDGNFNFDWFDEDADVGNSVFAICKAAIDNTTPESLTAAQIYKITQIATANKPYGLSVTVDMVAGDIVNMRTSGTNSFAAQGNDDCAVVVTHVN